MPRLASRSARAVRIRHRTPTVGARTSSLREPRLTQPVKTMLGILGVLVDCKTFPAFNCETGVDPQHLRSLSAGLPKLPRLGIGGREPKTEPLQIGKARYAFARQTYRLPVALEHVIGK